MPRFRTAAAASLLVIPIVAGGFLLQESPTRANAQLFDQVMSLVRNQYVDSIPQGLSLREGRARSGERAERSVQRAAFSEENRKTFKRSTGGRYGGTGMLLGEQAPA